VVSKPQSGSRLRRCEEFNCLNIFKISDIEPLGPTQNLGLRGGFEPRYRYLNGTRIRKTGPN
jgi:hypothetical protein